MSDSVTSTRVAFLVMPPGTGKSFLHKIIPGIIEADTLVPCRSTDKLATCRMQAKSSGNWKEYDSVWAELINAALPTDKKVIVLLPSFQVAVGTDWTSLGGICLSDWQWADNLLFRGATVNKYVSLRKDALDHGAEMLPTNAEVLDRVTLLAKRWVGPDST